MQIINQQCLRRLPAHKQLTTTGLAALVVSMLATAPALAAPLETYYIPIPEADVREALAELNPNNTSTSIETVVSIAVGFGGTVIRYDHQEDGYEADLENPLQGTSQVWGDGNPGNGFAPGFPGDVFSPGDVVILKNTVPTAPRGNAVLFDAADMFTVTQPVAVTRVAWAPNPGTVLAGAVEVFPTSQWGTEFESPLGEDFASSEMFELVTSSIMAAEDGTVIDFDFDADGAVDQTVNLDQGETFFSPLAEGFPLGNRASSNKPVQIHAITGDIGARWESRWAVVLPLDQWSDEYSLPVSTRESSSADPTDVFLYNPDPDNAITVSWETTGGAQTDVNVPARDMARVRIPDGPGANDTGARFFTADNSVFYAVAVIDANDPNSDNNNSNLNNRDYDWGIALLPNKLLSTQALVGFAPGIDPNACSAGAPFDCSTNSNSGGSPVWVMASAPTTVFIDFDADPTTGAQVDGFGNQYDTSVTLGSLERAKIFDPNDNDMTGALLYTLDGSLLAVAWGQDPSNSVRTNPYFDAGTIIPGLTTFTFTKEVNKAEVSPGDTLDYTLVVSNTSRANIPQVVLEDVLPPYVEYVPNSSTLDGSPFPDSGATAFPLDEGGAELGDLDPGEFFTFVFQVTVNLDTPVDDDDPDDCADPQTRLLNTGMATAIGVTREDDALTCVVFNPEIELLKQVSLSGGEPFFDADNAGDPDVPVGLIGADATYRLIVRNIGDIVLENLTVTDAQLGLNDAPVPGGPLNPGDERILGEGDFAELFFENRCDESGNKANTATVDADVANSDMTVSDSDPANVRCVDPGIELLKQVSLTGGAPFFDADTANAPDVPEGEIGADATYRLIVRNIGSEDLTDVRVSDATLGLNNVLVGNLAAGAEIVIDAGDAGFENLEQANRCDTPGDKLNTALVSGTGVDSDEEVTDEDPAYVRCLPMPGIELLKQVSLTGAAPFFDADAPDDADVPVGLFGADATYRLIVRNTGEEDLTDVVINDAALGLVDVPVGDLAAGDEIIIDAGMAGFANLEQEDRCDTPGDKPNIASVMGMGAITNDQVTDTNPAWIRCVPEPSIELLKQVSLTGGAPFFDADSSGAPDVPVGSLGADATYRLIVRNTGSEDLTNVTITDATLGLFNVPVDDLVAGAEVVIDAGNAGFGNLQQVDRCDSPGDKPNTALVEATGSLTGAPASDDDPAWVRCQSNPAIDIEKEVSLDGISYVDADTQEVALEGMVGDDAFYRLIVTNTGDEPLDNVRITDATLALTDVLVPGGVLQPGEQRIIDQGTSGFSALFFPDRCDMAGVRLNEATAAGDGAFSDITVTDMDPAYLNCTGQCELVVDKQCAPVFVPSDDLLCEEKIKATTLLYTGPSLTNATVVFEGKDGGDITYSGVDLVSGVTVLTDPSQNGYTVDAGEGEDLGSKTDITINGVLEIIHTSCSAIYEANRPAPLDGGTPNPPNSDKGDPSPNWFVINFEEKNGRIVQGPTEPLPGQQACTVETGSQVRYDYLITNTGDTDVSLTSVFDDKLSEQLDPSPQTLLAGESLTLSTTTVLNEDTVNRVDVFGNILGQSGATCTATDSVEVTVEEPVIPTTCKDIKDITQLTMVWNGPDGVNVVTENGQAFNDLISGNQITFNVEENDTTLTMSGAISGTSVFHRSCSDKEMDGSDDCGRAQGDGKDNDEGLNLWLLDGMTGEKGNFACNLPNTGVVDPVDPPPGGNVIGDPELDLKDDKKIKWELTNTGDEDVFIVSIVVEWPSEHEELKKMKLDGDFARNVGDEESPTAIPEEKSFVSGVQRRTLKAGKKKKLEIQFDKKFKDHVQSDYKITVEFSNGQVLSI